jgi:hypothetical protein
MLFDLEELLTRPLDLSCLETEFTKDEIIDVISDLPTDKSPRPDGFNSDFIKKYWETLEEDFLHLCLSFH